MAKKASRPAPLAEVPTEANPRERIGGNNPPVTLPDAATLKETLPITYAQAAATVTDMLAEARENIPAIIQTDEEFAVVTRTVVTMRNQAAAIEAARVKEKAEYLAAERTVDGFFKGLNDRLTTGMAVIGKRGDVYNQAKIARERAERERAAREAEEKARQEREEAERLQREADKARSKKKAAELTEQHTEQEAAAAVAVQQAQTAREAAAASSADIARQRFDSGHMATARQVGYVEITDYDKLPLELLRPYIKRDALDAAVKAYAKMTQYKASIPGAIIDMRDDTVYR